nr:immunoglobulin light chain junction region [Macaca mulatta]MOX17218.1 immunoglobulin light chain junction region [Macaca mulatta]MOX18866.1 immunoglobulin light chain junction region [Macaca mulatta]MOX19074.1 immunoglobulin light chain junction region [Macaca mulatta]MOX19244.1 immunoglobulin light chain junction region [Macaca mulatta]
DYFCQSYDSSLSSHVF